MSSPVNKYGVPCHRYELALADGSRVRMDVACEEDWGDVGRCCPGDCDDWENAIGWGNDADGHRKITAVTDCETGESLDPRHWAEELVWPYATNYSR